MRRVIMIIGVVIIIVMSIPFTIFAEKNMEDSKKEDSLNVSEETKLLLGVQNDEIVTRIYNVDLCLAFAECSNIDEALASREVLEIYYAIQTLDGSLVYKKFFDGECFEVRRTGVYETAWAAFHDDSIIKNISPDITVTETYYLTGEASHTGTAIYYRTDMGDFVYYGYLGDEYLFPIEDFCRYQKAIYDEYAKHGDQEGTTGIDGFMDLSPYDFHSSTFHVNVEMPSKTDKALVWGGIALGACILTAGVILGTVSYKKKHKV